MQALWIILWTGSGCLELPAAPNRRRQPSDLALNSTRHHRGDGEGGALISARLPAIRLPRGRSS